jgi:hypothetical protein
MLRHLSKIGLVPGVNIIVRELVAADNGRVIKCGKKEITVSEKVASAIWIKLK